MNADTKCKFDVAWNGSDVTVTVSPDSLRLRIGASETAELLKHEHDHPDILTGLATGRAILHNSSAGQTALVQFTIPTILRRSNELKAV
jgi:hypothetical protein